MDLNQSYTRIMKVIDSIQILQETHINAFETELIPNLEKHSLERQNQFNKFYVESGIFIAHLEKIKDHDLAQKMVEILNKKISGLMTQNDILSQKTKLYRDSIQASLNNLSRGKMAMGSYGTPDYIKNRPRAIHLTN